MKKNIVLIILMICLKLSVFAQNSLTVANSIMRNNDVINKQQVEYIDPGERGMNAVWDFRNTEVLSKAYRVEYSRDSDSTIYAIEPKFMNLYQMHGDTLVQTVYQDAVTLMTYHKTIPELKFPFGFGDTLSGDYKGSGHYSRHNAIQARGSILVEADGKGMLILTDKDTLINVLRIHTLKTSSFGLEKDSVVHDSTKCLLKVEEYYKWYARGYRYPVFETHSEGYYDGTDQLTCNRTAFRTLPDSLRLLVDSINMNIARNDSSLAKAEQASIIDYTVTNTGQNVKIDYTLKQQATISAVISDVMGVVYQHASRSDNAGSGYSITLNINNLRHGGYVLYLNVNGKVYSHKITVS